MLHMKITTVTTDDYVFTKYPHQVRTSWPGYQTAQSGHIKLGVGGGIKFVIDRMALVIWGYLRI